jgi:hemoglobin
MNTVKDLLTLEDIKKLVDTFYEKVRQDELLSPIFNERIQDRWPEHLEKMYAFWQTVLLHQQAYHGSPFPPHAQLPVNRSHFEKWMELFTSTVDLLFAGKKASEAKWRAQKMAEMFQSKIEFYRERGIKPLI